MKFATSSFLTVTVAVVVSAWMSPARAQTNPSSTGYVNAGECIVRFAQEIDVPSLQTGRVDEISVELNDFVKAGQEIARLDDRSLLIRRSAAQLKATVARKQSEDETEIEFAKVALLEAQEEFENSQSISKDTRGVIPNAEIRRMRLAVKRADLEITQARQRKERATVEADSLEAELSIIDDQLKHLHCESPISGVVLDLARNRGEWIAKGETIAKIGEIERIHVHALISSNEISRSMCRNLPVSVHWVDEGTGDNQSLRGKVLSIDPLQLPGGHYRIHAEIINQPFGSPSRHAAKIQNVNDLRLEPSSQTAPGWKLIPGTIVTMRVYTPNKPKTTARRSPWRVDSSQR